MGLQKYRADLSEMQKDGAIIKSAQWMGGPSLARIDNCRLANLQGDMRGIVYIQGEPDTFFSIPAVTRIMGKTVKGFVTTDDDGNLVFRHVYYA